MPYPVTLSGPRLTLREFAAEDLDALYSVYRDPVTTRNLSFSPLSREQVAETIERILALAAEQPRAEYALAVCVSATGELIGSARLALGAPDPRGPGEGIDPAADTVQFGIALHAGQHGRGYGRETVTLLLGFAFGTLGVDSVWGARRPANTASKNLMTALGFTETTTLPGHVVRDGVPHDSVIQTLTREAWEASAAS